MQCNEVCLNIPCSESHACKSKFLKQEDTKNSMFIKWIKLITYMRLHVRVSFSPPQLFITFHIKIDIKLSFGDRLFNLTLF